MSKMRVIQALHINFPDLSWRYDKHSFQWYNNAGWHVQAYSHFTPCSDMCDECYTTHYHRSDTNEIMYGLEFLLKSAKNAGSAKKDFLSLAEALEAVYKSIARPAIPPKS